jgi:hypothetical protein
MRRLVWTLFYVDIALMVVAIALFFAAGVWPFLAVCALVIVVDAVLLSALYVHGRRLQRARDADTG